MLLAFKFRLYPTAPQASALLQTAGVVRLTYNLALEQREHWHRQFRQATGRRMNFVSQGKELNELRAKVDFIAAAPRVCLEQALRDLDAAFISFFEGRSKFPKPRKRGVNDAFRFRMQDSSVHVLGAKWATVHVPKIGRVKYRSTRDLPEVLTGITVTLDAGKWFVVFLGEVAASQSDAAISIGIDRGVTNALALSTGEMFQIPTRLAVIEKRCRRAQRILARRRRGSNRRQRQRVRVANLYAQARRIRTDWQHRTTTAISRRFGVVALEALDTKSMTGRAHGVGVRQKAGLNRAIFNVGWGQVERMLAYKLKAAGGRLVFVDPAYTSQTCAECGAIDRRSRESQACFICVHCGHQAHADTNAAVNIRRASSSFLDGEGRHLGWPVEPSTIAA